MKKLLLIFLAPVFLLCDEYNYSLEDYNTTSPTYGLDVWQPQYLEYITLHYFSSQGWAGWTSTFGQLSNFQDDLRNDYGYENTVIIAVGQSNISNFNSNFTANSDLPLVMDQYPSLPIRSQFSPYGQHKQVIILGYDGEMLGYITLNSGLNNSAKNYIEGIIEEHYQQSVLGDVNEDTVVNVQDIIILVNIILNGQSDNVGDINSDGVVNILDVVQIVNYIMGNSEFSDNQICSADMNSDGGLNILDIVQIVNQILGGLL